MPDLLERFDPGAVEAFRYVDWDLDDATGELVLRYALDDLVLTERIGLPPGEPLAGPRAEAFERVARLLWLACGVSYYKAAAPGDVVVEGDGISDVEQAWAAPLFVEGLGEFWFTNQLDPRRSADPDTLGPAWTSRSRPPTRALSGLDLANRPLVPVGGGKDSCVTIEALRAWPETPLLGSVRRFPVIDAVMEASGLPSIHVSRVIDPRLVQLNSLGAYNGHVPVTAIVSLILVASALRAGCDAVVMSNERSASEGNVRWSGLDVNHQWSKSAAFEASLASVLRESVSPELRWFSLLRPFSELAIAQLFVRTGERYFDVFCSCNAAYRLDQRRRLDRWDRDCPKCRFVALALAPFLDPGELHRIQGGSMLDDLDQLPGFGELVGANGPKPLECVGELAESRVAVRLLSEDPRWERTVAVQALTDWLRDDGWPTDADVERVFSVDPAPLIPADYQATVDALAATLE